ncbi:methyltransferase domain-containing protein [Streptomyces sp. MS2.AVA.5]|uniref:Methyltransferase domain-containing protein n=1 Tax=Streptomyces achmelvichensis TaxID=3134111 RepID=A0ACC6PLI1_9ACTN
MSADGSLQISTLGNAENPYVYRPHYRPTFTDTWITMNPIEADRGADPDGHLAYLRLASQLPELGAVKERTYRALLGAGGSGVDVGCGLGVAVQELTACGMAPVGVESSRVALAQAQLAYPDGDFRHGTPADLPLESGTMEWYRAEHIYLQLSDTGAALAEAGRVLEPGGRLVLADPDIESALLSVSPERLARDIFTAFADWHRSGYIGRHAAELLRNTGFTDIRVDTVPVTFTDPAAAWPAALTMALAAARSQGALNDRQEAALRHELHERSRRGTFLLIMPFLITTARRA